MFGDLYDYISLMFAWRWPEAEGEITAVRVQHVQYNSGVSSGLRLVVEYKFSLGDGFYTGETRWSPWFGSFEVTDITDKLRIGQSVNVRYRRDNPTVNSLDRTVWQDLESLQE